jgi:taurine transport system permease protein
VKPVGDSGRRSLSTRWISLLTLFALLVIWWA